MLGISGITHHYFPMPTEPFFIAQGASEIFFLPQMANRHGLIAGATGTGKTVTLRVLAENFSAIGVPVFMADVKGDLSGLAKPGADNPKVKERATQMGLELTPNGFPVEYWDVFGDKGLPVRTTISELGPVLLARMLDLNDTQEEVLQVVFAAADEEKLLLLDLKDLQAMLQYAAANATELSSKYGNVSTTTLATIQRSLLSFTREGGKFFGEPALSLGDFIKTAPDGRGVINILAADKLITSPRTYSAFLLWMLSELFERLPEKGDVDKPELVFFFDEAHLLFDTLPQALQDKVEQVVRLIRSKGVGVYFVSQNPLDIPDKVLGQLGNRFQHALRAFTPRDQQAVKVAATTFRQNPRLDVEKAIGELQVGEALVSLLDAKGTPSIVERAFIAPPVSFLPPLGNEDRKVIIEGSELYDAYAVAVDRESAYEVLNRTAAPAPARTVAATAGAAGFDAVAAARARAEQRRTQQSASPQTEPERPANTISQRRVEEEAAAEREAREQDELHAARMEKLRAEAAERQAKAAAAEALAAKRSEKPGLFATLAKAATQSATRSMATQAGRSLFRGIFGTLFGGGR